MLRNPALTVGISPPPDVLESLSDKPGFRGRGLIARFLYRLPVSLTGFRELKPTPCPFAVEKAYCDGIRRLLKLAPPTDEAGHWQPWRLRFSPRAYDAWKAFQRAIEILMREPGKLHYLKDWGSKLPGAAARIAGVLHCVLVDPTESTVISEDTVEGALNLVTPLIDHTLAVFNLMERDKNSEDAQKILAWILKQGETSFTLRDCFCAHQSRFKTMDGIRLPISLLEQHYCIRPRPKETAPHRPSEVYDVNPKLLEASA
jgi:putative DNA primase/helicase